MPLRDKTQSGMILWACYAPLAVNEVAIGHRWVSAVGCSESYMRCETDDASRRGALTKEAQGILVHGLFER